MKRLTIKMRVTLWFTLVMVLMVVLILLCLITVGRHITATHSRQVLTEAVRESFYDITEQDGNLEVSHEPDFFTHGVYLTVYDEEEKLVYGRMTSGFDDSLPLSSGDFRTVHHGMSDSWYVYDLFRPLSGERSIWIRGVLSASDENGAFMTIINLAVVLLPVVILIAALVGYWLVARAFKPVRIITESAEHIADGTDLSMRIGLGFAQGNDEIYHLAATFDSMLERLQASFERERQFSSDVSHELRAPTAVIISQCEYALEEAQTLEEAKSALSTVLLQAEQMSALVGQLLMLSRVGKGQEKLNLEQINLSELTELVAAQMEESAVRKQITIHTDIEPDLILEGDETMLMRLLLNLMENAVKYGKQNGRITVTLRRQNDMIEGSVADDGIGIAPGHLAKIWHRLYQVDAARSSGGIGLGLPMVKYIAEAHGGTVRVESTAGKGSIFFFSLPIR